MKTDCIFCKIVAGDMPSFTVYEDGDTKAFLDIFGATDGHTMVILKKHGETILDYTKEDLGNLFWTVRKVSDAIEKTYKTTVLSIGINHGEPQGVKHLHVHILPRYEGDNGGIMQSLPGRKLTDRNFREVAGKIARHIR